MLSCKLYLVHTRIIADSKGAAADLLMNAPRKLLVMHAVSDDVPNVHVYIYVCPGLG